MSAGQTLDARRLLMSRKGIKRLTGRDRSTAPRRFRSTHRQRGATGPELSGGDLIQSSSSIPDENGSPFLLAALLLSLTAFGQDAAMFRGNLAHTGVYKALGFPSSARSSGNSTRMGR